MLKVVHEIAATALAQARTENRKLERLPESCRPETEEDALQIQRVVVQLLDDRIGGWKCALPRGENLFLAPLLASTLRRDSPCPIIPHGRIAKIEPEIAYVLRRNIPPKETPYTSDELSEAIGEMRLVLELIGSRYMDHKAITFPEFLADSINNQGLFVGPRIEEATDQQLNSLRISVEGPSGLLSAHDGVHPNGHPMKPLVWLAEFAGRRGETLKAGEVITTGSYAGILEVPLEMPLKIMFGGLGQIEISFTPDSGSSIPA